MKINFPQLLTQIKQPLAPLYWLASDEPLLTQQATDVVRRYAHRQQIDERLRYEIDSHFNWQQLIIASQNLSLFATHRLLELHFTFANLNAEIGQMILRLIEQTRDSDIVLITTPRLDNRLQQTQWFKKIEQEAIFTVIWPIDYKQLPQWIQQQAKRYQLKIAPAVCQLLANRYENNLLAIDQVLARFYYSLTDIQQDNWLTEEWLEKSTDADARYLLFDLTEACLAANYARINAILTFLRQENSEPILVLWGLVREIRLLLSLQLAHQQGKDFAITAKQLRIPLRRHADYRKACQRFTIEQLEQMLKFAQRIDNALKGALTLPVWPALQDLCFLCAGLVNSVLYFSGVSNKMHLNHFIE